MGCYVSLDRYKDPEAVGCGSVACATISMVLLMDCYESIDVNMEIGGKKESTNRLNHHCGTSAT